MKYLLLISISFTSLKCFAQNDTADFKHSHRFWINPTQIITGQYTLAFSWRIHGGNNWMEIAAGYRYFPFRSLEPVYAPGGIVSTPKYGILFTGPVLSIATEKFYNKVKKRMSKAAEHDPHIQKMLRNEKLINSFRYLLQFQYLSHGPACYYEGEENDSYTYSAIMNYISGEALWSRIIGNDSNHIIWQSYIGIGFHFGVGNETKYTDPIHQYGGHDKCVQNIHDPNVVATKEIASYFFPMLQLGIRMGFQ